MIEKLYNVTMWNEPNAKLGVHKRRLLNADRKMLDNFILGCLDNDWKNIKITRVK